jgi:hypothetical protein
MLINEFCPLWTQVNFSALQGKLISLSLPLTKLAPPLKELHLWQDQQAQHPEVHHWQFLRSTTE